MNYLKWETTKKLLHLINSKSLFTNIYLHIYLAFHLHLSSALGMAINIDGADEEQIMTNNFTFKRTGRGAPDKCTPKQLAENKKFKIDLYNNLSGIVLMENTHLQLYIIDIFYFYFHIYSL